MGVCPFAEPLRRDFARDALSAVKLADANEQLLFEFLQVADGSFMTERR